MNSSKWEKIKKLHEVTEAVRKRRRLLRVLIAAFWLVVWFALAKLVNNKLLLVTPGEALHSLLFFLTKPNFWLTVCMSVLRIVTGFLAGCTVGLLLAAFSYRYKIVEMLVKPLMDLLKTIPVVSFVVLLLIWWGASMLSFAICFLIVFPNIYISTLEGFKNTPQGMLEMKTVFRLPLFNSLFYIYRPTLKPFLYSAFELSLGMCWKSGVAAEVIGTPRLSIGEQLYLSKIYLDTGGIFAWTAVIILLSIGFEKLCLFAADKLFNWEPACKKPNLKRKQPAVAEGICCDGLCKRYDENVVLQNYHLKVAKGETASISWPSGTGKTTLLRILAGLEKAESGEKSVSAAVAMVFQEDRLCEDFDAVKNVELVTGDENKAREELLCLLEEEDLEKPVKYLSGGQKRRVGIVRAMAANSDVIFMDEPFSGMDYVTRTKVNDYIENRKGDRSILIATHI